MGRFEGGVSFRDVREHAHALGELQHCIIHFEQHLPMRKNVLVTWHVRAVARWYDERGNVRRERGEGGQWPCNECATYAGLQLMLLHRLERKIEAEVIDEARAAVQQGRLF